MCTLEKFKNYLDEEIQKLESSKKKLVNYLNEEIKTNLSKEEIHRFKTKIVSEEKFDPHKFNEQYNFIILYLNEWIKIFKTKECVDIIDTVELNDKLMDGTDYFGPHYCICVIDIHKYIRLKPVKKNILAFVIGDKEEEYNHLELKDNIWMLNDNPVSKLSFLEELLKIIEKL